MGRLPVRYTRVLDAAVEKTVTESLDHWERTAPMQSVEAHRTLSETAQARIRAILAASMYKQLGYSVESAAELAAQRYTDRIATEVGAERGTERAAEAAERTVYDALSFSIASMCFVLRQQGWSEEEILEEDDDEVVYH